MPLHPRLQMIGNGGQEVNALRAQLSAVVVSQTRPSQLAKSNTIFKSSIDRKETPPGADDIADLVAQSSPYKATKRLKLEEQPPAADSFVNVYIELNDQVATSEQLQQAIDAVDGCRNKADKLLGHGTTIAGDNLLLSTVPIADLESLSDLPGVRYVHAADRLSFDTPEETTAEANRPRVQRFALSDKHSGGDGVLVGIIDVGGIDFAHPDFLDDDGNTRFVRIWDQGGDFRDPPDAFGYGTEFDKEEHLDPAIRQADGGIPAHWMERQSQMRTGSHATHVAGIAAGRFGVCPNAEIAAVLIDMPAPAEPEDARRQTFSDSSRIVHAVEYLWTLAEARQKALVINISLGTNGGAHDGSSPVSRWIDSRLRQPGRAICVAAGNAGQESSRGSGDIGFAMGRIHTSGRIPSRGLELDLRWFVAGGEIADLSENELELWFEPQDRVTILLSPPDSDTWIEVNPQEFVTNRRLRNGTNVSIFNELYHPANGSNKISIYLSPNLEVDNWQPVQGGIWTVRLRGEEIRDGRFHGWIERDDPIVIDDTGDVALWRFPSFFAGSSNVDSHSINSLACGHNVMAVANLDAAQAKVNITSSQGPTRDGRAKPEICAPGTAILAPNGFGGPDDPAHIAKSGTSMASPYVAGVIGLMLCVNERLTAAQCLAIIRSTAQPLPGDDYQWRDGAGFGQIDANTALREARDFEEQREL